MKIKLLIASCDDAYSERLSSVFSKRHADSFEVSVCKSPERLRELLSGGRYDVALLDRGFKPEKDGQVQLPLYFVDESGVVADKDMKHVRKYQRISSIAGNILQLYSEVGHNINSFSCGKANITVVWSPSGGAGKTTVALAFAAHSVLNGKNTVYLSFENFSSTSVYFQEDGRSISKAFEKLEANLGMFLTGIRQKDGGSGISYFTGPENYEDMNILSPDDIETLIGACAAEADELVIDLSSQCDERSKKAFALANTVFIVCDPTSTSQAKLKQFVTQHNVFGQIQGKSVLVNNKGASTADAGISRTIRLPMLNSNDAVSVYKSLSGSSFA